MPVVFFHGVLGFLPYGLTIDLLAEMHAGAIYLPIFPTWAVAAPPSARPPRAARTEPPERSPLVDALWTRALGVRR